jgi:hypothetical protein
MGETDVVERRKIKNLETGVQVNVDDIVRDKGVGKGVVTYSSETMVRCTLRVGNNMIERQTYGCEYGKLVHHLRRTEEIYRKNSPDPIEVALFNACDKYLTRKGVPKRKE